MTFTPAAASATCLGRTCLHWRADGELDRDDLRVVLARLAVAEGRDPLPSRLEPPAG